MDFDQGELDFNSNGAEDGFRKWRRDLDGKKRAFEARHGIILGKSVRVQLRGEWKPLEGTMRVISKQVPGASALLRLCIGGREFSVSEIESIVAVEGTRDG